MSPVKECLQLGCWLALACKARYKGAIYKSITEIRGSTEVKVVAIVQARMGSTRLPGKVLMDLAGKPVLARCLERLRRSKRLDEIVVATTTLPGDRQLVEWCEAQDRPVFQGDPEDLLDRYYKAAKAFSADVIVRCTSDCPVIDPELVDQTVSEFLDLLPNVDYASTRLPKYHYPRGLDTEVVSMAALETIWREDTNPDWREHVTPYIYFHPERFRIHGVMHPQDFSRYRLTVDTPQDLELIRLIYDHFDHDRFSWQEAVALLKSRPEWVAINAEVQQKEVSQV